MPHKLKQVRERQHHRRLPHVQEEPEGEKDPQDEASHSGRNVQAVKSAGKQYVQKEMTGPSETLAMEGKYAKLESSPLPLRRALLSSVAGRKCGPSTPVPSWKMHDHPLQGALELANSPSLHMRGMAARQSGCPRNSVSARKLAASLWEMQGALNPQSHQGKDELNPQHHMVNCEHDHKGKEGLSQQATGAASHQHRSHEDKGASSKQPKLRKSSSKGSHPRSPDSPTPREVEVTNGSSSFAKIPRPIDVDAAQLRGEDGSTLSCELAKVLNQIWSLEEQHKESTSMVASLHTELKKTRAHIKELQVEQSTYQEDVKMLNKKLADEKKMLRDRAEEAVLAAVKPLKEELENERKSKVKLESKHKKLSKEMNDARKTLTKTMQEFEKEQKARELMEDVCDELAREIGEDKAQVEELKRQSAKYREEVEQERRMLQMAEVWREERVHMKLAEARFELEERNTALDKLRSELEAFLRVKRSLDEGNNSGTSNLVSISEEATPSAPLVSNKHIQGGQQRSKNVLALVDGFPNEKRSRDTVGEAEGEDSLDDDLHSIELNRISYSGSHEGPSSVYSNSVNSKAIANGKHSSNNGAFQASSLSTSMNGVTKGKQGELNNLSLDRVTSALGKARMSESVTSEIQEVDMQVSGRGSERDLKDWDLGKMPAAWSSEGLPRLWHDTNEDGVGLNVKGGSGLGQMDSLSRSASKCKSTGAGDRVHAKLEIFESPEDGNLEGLNGGGLLSFGRQAATFLSSPTRKWGPSRSSPDPSQQPVENMPIAYKDNSLKAKLLEAKLEGQQAKLRSSKAA